MRPNSPVLSAMRGWAFDELDGSVTVALADSTGSSVELLTRFVQLTSEGIVALLNTVRSAHSRVQK